MATTICFGPFCLTEDLIFGLCIADADQMIRTSDWQPISGLASELLEEVRATVIHHPFRQMLSQAAQQSILEKPDFAQGSATPRQESDGAERGDAHAYQH
jgi:hypothetical protein